MSHENMLTKARQFWNHRSFIEKHLLGVLLSFIMLPISIVLNKLGFHDLAMGSMMALTLLVGWAFGVFYLIIGLLRLLPYVLWMNSIDE
jgi:uncharacterized membrane protein YGL010W